MIEIKDADILRLQPGDILVVNYPGSLPKEQSERLKAVVQEKIPDTVSVLVLCDGLTMSILRPASRDREAVAA